MKIEKVNDHQIRCTLTKDDLEDRQLKISELAYGTQKAKDLFRDMMLQAQLKFGFEAEDIPLMIEAIPLSGGNIVLIITKVEDPEELDTRFSKFAPSINDHDEQGLDLLGELPEGAEEILDLFKRVKNHSLSHADSSDKESEDSVSDTSGEEKKVCSNITRMISFSSLDPLLHLAGPLCTFYNGVNSLYKHKENKRYYLVAEQSDHLPAEFNRLCNTLSEHGKIEKYSLFFESHLKEHHTLLIKDHALNGLREMYSSSVN